MSRPQRLRVTLPAVIALGSNLGDRERALRTAVGAIRALEGVRLDAASDIVETPALTPHGIDESAPSYLNAVVLVTTSLEPERLLTGLQEIERELGRVRAERWGNRIIDLDLIAVNGLRMRSDTLTLPHPRAHERAFVLAPWAQLSPAAVLPGHGAVTELARAVTDPVRPYAAAPLLPAVPA